MFEVDDFDEVLSQVDLSDVLSRSVSCSPHSLPNKPLTDPSPARKEEVLNSFFNCKNVRSFPGPAGILNSENIGGDKNIRAYEIRTQDVESIKSSASLDTCTKVLWEKSMNLLDGFNIPLATSILDIQTKAQKKSLKDQRAGIVVGIVDTIERSALDLLVRLRDPSDKIKCTLHRDVWSRFAPYVVAQASIIALYRPTVFTAGKAQKTHYLNITLGSILAIFSLHKPKRDNEINLPEGFERTYFDSIVVIKKEKLCDFRNDTDTLHNSLSETDASYPEAAGFLLGLDESSFFDDEF